MVANFVRGGAAINVLADAAGAELVVVDVGVAGPSGDGPPANAAASGAARLVRARIAARDPRHDGRARHDAATRRWRPSRSGDGSSSELIAGGIDTIAVGEMGIGNTTAASALVAALTGGRRPT